MVGSAYLTRRLLHTVVVLIGVSTVVFFTMHLSGDPVSMLLPQDATKEDRDLLAHQMGLDQPLLVQYFDFMGRALIGDFGESIRFRGQPAMAIVLDRLPATIELAIAAFVLSLVIGIPAGIIAAQMRNSLWDNLSMFIALIFQSTPGFWLGIMLILLLSVQWGLLPTSGRGGLDHLIMPAFTLAAFYTASIARLVRSSLLEVIGKDYVRTARAKGLTESVVISRHALKNAAMPVVTLVGMQLALFFGGAVITETVFAWPGMGRLAVLSIYSRDYPIVQAVVFLAACGFVFMNLIVDLTYLWLDPQVRYE